MYRCLQLVDNLRSLGEDTDRVCSNCIGFERSVLRFRLRRLTESDSDISRTTTHKNMTKEELVLKINAMYKEKKAHEKAMARRIQRMEVLLLK